MKLLGGWRGERRYRGRLRARVAPLAVAALLAVACGRSAPSGVVGLDGGPADPLAGDAAVTVLVFLSTECPISDRYAPELARLRARFEPRGVAFWFVYPTPEESSAAIAAHLREFGVTVPAVRDPGHALARRAEVGVTPEGAVFVRGGALAYHGRIDDLYVDFGQVRAEATRHDLADAIEASLAGRPAAPASGKAVGCAISGAP